MAKKRVRGVVTDGPHTELFLYYFMFLTTKGTEIPVYIDPVSNIDVEYFIHPAYCLWIEGKQHSDGSFVVKRIYFDRRPDC